MVRVCVWTQSIFFLLQTILNTKLFPNTTLFSLNLLTEIPCAHLFRTEILRV
jgi:hypothetical protein